LPEGQKLVEERNLWVNISKLECDSCGNDCFGIVECPNKGVDVLKGKSRA